MVFSSLSFLFLFLPLVLFLFYAANPLFRPAILLLASLVFYFFGENYLIWVMLATTVLNFLCALFMTPSWRGGITVKLSVNTPRTKVQKSLLFIALAGSLGALFYFKYFEFFSSSLRELHGALNLGNMAPADLAKVALPLGISFYVFQSISYTIDVYRGSIAASRNPWVFATYVMMFPQLVAGPIVRYSDVEGQIHAPRCTPEAFAEGVRRFIGGLAKKVLIANPMGQLADAIFGLPEASLSTGLAWMGLMAYTLQIYFDFSGYSCMAIGLGRMFGFTFPENFIHPYTSRSVREFWRRWHVTLSTWLRDYLYIPLGGSRKSEWQTRANLLIVFLACGLWHGASWSFVVWGLFHGSFIALERTKFGLTMDRMPRILRHAYLILVVMIGWVFFRCETLPQALDYLLKLVSFDDPGIRSIAEFMSPDHMVAMILGIVFCMPVVPWLRFRVEQLAGLRLVFAEFLWFLCLSALFIFSVASVTAGNFNPFIYFRF
jgi:alginate O-acetyltransferase complex protein AlgI